MTQTCDKRCARFALGVLCVCVLAGTVSARAASRHREGKTVAASSSAAGGAASARPYAAACVMEPITGTVIFASNEHQPRPTASLTKMMLTLIVAEKLNDGSLKLTDRVTASRKAAQMGGSQVYLKEGEIFSLDDMMKAIVVHSANDASVAVAEYLAGSTEAFVQMMTQKARELGMKDTRYYSVHGLPAARGQETDVSSAYDQALLARALVAYPQVIAWSGIRTAPFRDGRFELRNTNHLVFDYDGCDGLKTGFYHEAGFNVVATARRNGMRLIAAVLGSERKGENFRSAAEMLSRSFANYELRTIAKKGSTAGQSVAIVSGSSDNLTPVWASDIAIFRKRGDKDLYKVEYDLPASLPAPITAGQKVGTGRVIVDGQPQTVGILLAPSNIPRRSGLLGRLRKIF